MNGKTVERICEACHRPFMAPMKNVKRGFGRFCSHSCSMRTARWKGGKRIDDHGYVRIYDKNGRYRREHRVVMEQHLGRPLKTHEIVHHKNRDKTDNRVDNLEITNRPSHSSLHILERGHKKLDRWSRKYDKCIQCGTTERKHRSNGLCTLCRSQVWRDTH